MGMIKLFSDLGDYNKEINTSPNPNKYNFKVLIVNNNFKQRTGMSLLMVHYPDCTTFDGLKLLIIENYVKSEELDPHFLEDNNIVARFKANKKGLELAEVFLNGLVLHKNGKM